MPPSIVTLVCQLILLRKLKTETKRIAETAIKMKVAKKVEKVLKPYIAKWKTTIQQNTSQTATKA